MIIYGVGGNPVDSDSYQYEIVKYFLNKEDADNACAAFNAEYDKWSATGFDYWNQPRFQDTATVTEITVH
jgi:hypothetical protein